MQVAGAGVGGRAAASSPAGILTVMYVTPILTGQ